MSTFDVRMKQLQAEIGFGTLRGVIEVDQIYAHYQHEDLTLEHKYGGQGKFLSTALLARMDGTFRTLADSVLEGRLTSTMIAVTEEVAEAAKVITPILPAPGVAGILRKSYHVTVTDDGVTVYDKPPEVPRLLQKTITTLHKVAGAMAQDD